MRARLFSKHGALHGLESQVADVTTIGRGSENTLSLEPKGISNKHARIFFDSERGCYMLEDLGSLNGTELDGIRVRGPERLGHLHVITFAGAYDMVFQDLELCERRHGDGAGTRQTAAPIELSTGIERDPPALPKALADLEPEDRQSDDAGGRTGIEKRPVEIPTSLARSTAPKSRQSTSADEGQHYALLVTLPEGPEQTFELKEGENLVGRASMARVSLDRLEVSRSHAVIKIKGDRVTLRDLGSANATWVGADKLESQIDIEIGTEDALRFGEIRARLVRSERS